MIALAIFAGTYLVLAIGGLPGFRIDRTGAAIIGASLMVGFNAHTFEEAIQAVDHSTLVLLFGMMIVVVNLRLSGFFRVVAPGPSSTRIAPRRCSPPSSPSPACSRRSS